MQIEITCPDSNGSARDYILELVFGEVFGLTWVRSLSPTKGFQIRLSGRDGVIRLPDYFLAESDSAWLSPATLPETPLPNWDTTDLAVDIPLVHPVVPVLYGDVHPVSRMSGGNIELPIDIFGSAFFMLSRYEEAVLSDRDQHDRFPARASLAYKAGFLDRPIIDEYVEILWAVMQCLWPGLERITRRASTLVSCDVDQPFSLEGSIMGMGRRLAGNLLRGCSPFQAGKNLLCSWRTRNGDHSADALRTHINFIMDENEKAGNTVAFYFIPENTDRRWDCRENLDEPRMRALLREIHQRGHEIGLHPGYNTYKHPDAFARSVTTLRRVLDEERIEQPLLGGRQHFLRWETPTTARLWEENALSYDSTLAYADSPGFRCGTCRDYKMFDIIERRELKLIQRPLIVMECSVIAERYLGLGYSDAALELMLTLKRRAHTLSGNFTLLWHNSHFQNPQDRELYRVLINQTG